MKVCPSQVTPGIDFTLFFAFKGHNNEIRVNDKAPKKRLRSDDGEDYLSTFNSEAVSDNVQMLMLKAESLVHLQKPLEALQSLNRYCEFFFKRMRRNYISSCFDAAYLEKTVKF